MTIDDLKRALVEVRHFCENRTRCTEPDICPFYNVDVQWCSIDGSEFPEYWTIGEEETK